MFAHVAEFSPKFERKHDFLKRLRVEVLPILKKQKGFLEILAFCPETKNEKTIAVTLWMEKSDAEKYEREVYPPRVEQILRPYLAAPVTFKHYIVETTLCEEFVTALASTAPA